MVKEINAAIGKRLRSARKQAGLSGKKAGNAIGVSQQLISDQEKGKKQVSLSQLISLAALYGKSMAELLADFEARDAQSYHFADAHQASYHAAAVDAGSVRDKAVSLRLDLSELADSADRKLVRDLFEKLKRLRPA